MMGIFEVASLVFTLVSTFGPAAKQVWDDWHAEVGDNPTPEQWAALQQKIADHNPDTY
jgi:hypothetical protein